MPSANYYVPSEAAYVPPPGDYPSQNRPPMPTIPAGIVASATPLVNPASPVAPPSPSPSTPSGCNLYTIYDGSNTSQRKSF